MKVMLFCFMCMFGAMMSFARYCHADTVYVFECQDSKITGRIKYSVIGQYRSNFKECSGIIEYNRDQKKIKSVSLTIQPKSIHSECQWCDDIVRSKQLLDIQKYPIIEYKAIDFENKDGQLLATGQLSLHGVTRQFTSSFVVEEKAQDTLEAMGKWVIRRKDFGITWNKLLDHGGVLVGDHITVDWHIKARSPR